MKIQNTKSSQQFIGFSLILASMDGDKEELLLLMKEVTIIKLSNPKTLIIHKIKLSLLVQISSYIFLD